MQKKKNVIISKEEIMTLEEYRQLMMASQRCISQLLKMT